MEWTTISIILATLFLGFIWSKSRRPKNFPPGPQIIPFFGNLLSMGHHPQLTILKWAKQYGDVFTFYEGRKPTVILSDISTARRVLGDEAATGRDDDSVIVFDASTQKGHGVVSTQGEVWRTHRRFALSTLRDLGMGKNSLEEAILLEVDHLCGWLRESGGNPVNPAAQLTKGVCNVICQLIFGQRFSLTDPKFSHMTGLISASLDGFKVDHIVRTFPFLMYFPNPLRTRILHARECIRTLTGFFKERVDEHDTASSGEERDGLGDYLFAYQAERSKEKDAKSGSSNQFNEPQLIATLSDLFDAGTETTATTILWALVYMLQHPAIMRTVQEEIDTSVGRDRTLTIADKSLLPYTVAMIFEVQRYASILPLAVPRTTTEDMTVNGYTLPRGTTVAANLYSIHRDPRWWENPEQFDPSRFLDSENKLIRHEAFAPFSVGKRSCMGESLAKMELFLFISNLLRCFTLELSPGKAPPTDCFSCIIITPLPFELKFIPRI